MSITPGVTRGPSAARQPVADPEHYGPFTYGKGQHDTVYIIDVDGTRWVIATNYLPGTSAASIAELEQLATSIGFED